MANFSGYFSEESTRIKSKLFPKAGGNYGSFSSVIEELFIKWVKEKDTIEFWECQKDKAMEYESIAKEIKNKSNFQIEQIKNKSIELLNKNWNHIKSLKGGEEFILNTVELIKSEEFNIEENLILFNKKFSKKIDLNYYIKFMDFVKQ